MKTKILIGLCVVLLFGMTVNSADVVVGWSTNVFCFYNLPENFTKTDLSQCYELINVKDAFLYNNFVFVISPAYKFTPSYLFVVDISSENVMREIEYKSSKKIIAKYRYVLDNPGQISSLCSSGDNLAYGSSDNNLYFYEKAGSSWGFKWKNLGEGTVKSCDMLDAGVNKYTALCTGNYIKVFDKEGNVEWKKDLGETCIGSSFFKESLIAATKNKFYAFGIDGNEIFDAQISGINSIKPGKKALILADDGVYVFDGRSANKIIGGKFDGISSSENSDGILVYKNSDFNVYDYTGKSIMNSNLTAENITSSAIDGTYAVVGTSSSNFYVFETDNAKSGYLVKIPHESYIPAFYPKVTSLTLKEGKIIAGYSDGGIHHYNLILTQAIKSLSDAESKVATAKSMNLETKELESKLDEIRKAYAQLEYSKVVALEKEIDYSFTDKKKVNALATMTDIQYLIEKVSDYGLVIPRTIKENYDFAFKNLEEGNYDIAQDYLNRVKSSLSQFIRDKALDRITAIKNARDAFNKESIPTTLDAQISEVEVLKDYAAPTVLFDKVREADNTVTDQLNKLFEEAEGAIANAHKKWIMADPKTEDPETQVDEARADLKQEDFAAAIGKLTTATKHAKDLKTLAIVQDICILIIVISAVIVLIFFIRRPKVGGS